MGGLCRWIEFGQKGGESKGGLMERGGEGVGVLVCRASGKRKKKGEAKQPVYS